MGEPIEPIQIQSQDVIKKLEAKIGEQATTISALEIQIDVLREKVTELTPDSDSD